ncbi:MAG: Cytochrome b6 [Chlamydiae bacterium]|nr:Cytochrome b6 [Chlamydiota bacterium]
MNGVKKFTQNIRDIPSEVVKSVSRYGAPTSDRAASEKVFHNFFLHIHSVKTHLWTLKPFFTMGLGMISFASFVLLTISGIVLMFYYKPTVAEAYDSIKEITYVVPMGYYLRASHRWLAHIMVIAVMVHMARVFFTASYKGPRKFNWVIGVFLFATTLGLSFTGYLLPWDQLAYWAATIGANIAESPKEVTDALGITSFFDIGGIQKRILLGGTTVGGEALLRFYLLHVVVLPILLISLIGVHFWRIRKDGGMSRPSDVDQRLEAESTEEELLPVTTQRVKAKSFGLMCFVKGKTPPVKKATENTVNSWPHAFYAEMGLFNLTFLICLIWTAFAGAPLKEIANPFLPENPAKAPWYFLGLQELVSYSAFMGGFAIPVLTILSLILIPYIDRDKGESGIWFPENGEKRLILFSILYASTVVIGLEAFAINFGWLRNWFPNIPQLFITFLNPGTLLVAAFAYWSVRTIQKTGSVRLGGVAFFTCFLVGFIILTVIGVHFRGPNWDFFWSPSQWPIH